MCTNISHFANIFSRRSNFAAFLFDFNPNHPRKTRSHHARRPHLLLLPAPGPVLSGPVCAWRTVGKGGSGTITPPAGMRAMPGAGEGIFAGSGEGSSNGHKRPQLRLTQSGSNPKNQMKTFTNVHVLLENQNADPNKLFCSGCSFLRINSSISFSLLDSWSASDR